MRRPWVCVALATAASTALAGCEQRMVADIGCDPPLTISLSTGSMAAAVGGQVRVLAIVVGTCGHPRTLTWATRDTTIATVAAGADSAGYSVAVVTGRSLGTTLLVATSAADSTVKAAAFVTVAQLAIDPVGVPGGPRMVPAGSERSAQRTQPAGRASVPGTGGEE